MIGRREIGLCLLTLASFLWMAASDNGHTEIHMTSSCSPSNTSVTYYVAESMSFSVTWKGDYPFSGNQNCKLKFQPMDVKTICLSVGEFRMESSSSYMKYYKNNDTLPFKIYSKGNDPYTLCEDFDVIYVEIGDASLTSLVTGSHVEMKLYTEIESLDDDGINRWVLISIVASLVALLIPIGCVVLRYCCIYRMRQKEIAARSQAQGNLGYPTNPPPQPPPQTSGNYGGQFGFTSTQPSSGFQYSKPLTNDKDGFNEI